MMEPLFDMPENTAEPEPTAVGGGKPRLERANRQQVEMRLTALDDLVPAEHLVRLIWAMVEQMDLSTFYAQVQAVEGEAGRPAIDPAILLAVWLYATAEGVSSARELDRLCREHIAYQWLVGGVTVNYHTLSDFRVEHEQALDELLTRHVAALMAEGSVTLARTAQDGVRIRASAGSGSFRRRERLEQFQAEAQVWVEQLKAQAQAEGDPRPARQQAAQERAARERLARVKAALAELRQVEQRQVQSHKKKSGRKPARCSTTDPSARRMKMADGGWRPAYNGQLAVDTASGVIVGVDITHQVDQGQLGPMLTQLNRRYGQLPKEHLVDGGFVTEADLEASLAAGVQVYAPLPAPPLAGQAPAVFTVAAGPGVRAWRERMRTAAAQLIYKLRAQTVEWANAGLRQRGLYQFLVRGQHKARAVLLWFALTHNLLRSIALQARTAMT